MEKTISQNTESASPVPIIRKVKIENYKCFGKMFSVAFENISTVIVGTNESGKSTILEAINLAFSGYIQGKHVRNILSENLFNQQTVNEYLRSILAGTKIDPPAITIEIYTGDNFPALKGNNNSDNVNTYGFTFKISLNERLQKEYLMLLNQSAIQSIPIEYYSISWTDFARTEHTPRSLPIKTVILNSQSLATYNGGDLFLSRIVDDMLEPEDIHSLSQAYRQIHEQFKDNSSITSINSKLAAYSELFEESLAVTTALPTIEAWRDSLVTTVADIPFSQTGLGKQTILKTKLMLTSKRSRKCSVILIDEPENHLTYGNMAILVENIIKLCESRQTILVTHSSFVLNKIGLDSLVLLNQQELMTFSALPKDTIAYFKKLPGYNTLRLLLSRKTILVEGPSEELYLQRAYMDNNHGKIPLADGVDVLSVGGLAFLRFLQLAEPLNLNAHVVTDNDGDIKSIKKKYESYLNDDFTQKKESITIHFPHIINNRIAFPGLDGNTEVNLNTVESEICLVNEEVTLRKILELDEYKGHILSWMQKNKTKCALRIFEADENIKYPLYIMDALSE
jgi:putative ATP-dependent endonuclease of the OLD family